jgi:hypothetical protein
MPAGVPLPWSAQSYHHETDGTNAAPGVMLEAIPRLQSVGLLPPVPEVLDVDELVVDPDALVDPAPPVAAPVDPEVLDEEVVAPPAPAPVDVECAEPQATLPAMVTNPQTVGSRMALEPSYSRSEAGDHAGDSPSSAASTSVSGAGLP